MPYWYATRYALHILHLQGFNNLKNNTNANYAAFSIYDTRYFLIAAGKCLRTFLRPQSSGVLTVGNHWVPTVGRVGHDLLALVL
jgi:hypothetical protein